MTTFELTLAALATLAVICGIVLFLTDGSTAAPRDFEDE